MDNFRANSDSDQKICPILCITKTALFVVISLFVLYVPLGDPLVRYKESNTIASTYEKNYAVCFLCNFYKSMESVTYKTRDTVEALACIVGDILYESKLKFYTFLSKIDGRDLCRSICCPDKVNEIEKEKDNVRCIQTICKCVKDNCWKNAIELAKEEVDNVIEDEITHKLSGDLLQSIERKFQVDLEKSVDMVLVKIKLLLQNGTTHIHDKLVELQESLQVVKEHGEKEIEDCLVEHQNETAALAEKALHQMVVCGYALIGHDPAQAINSVISLKSMIKEELKPLYEQKKEVYSLIKVCGHDHESLKKVIKCVISKSPLIKSAMMVITGKMIEGVVTLTKQMAHGAMYEACLIEVIRTTEDEAFSLVKNIRKCVYGNDTIEQVVSEYLNENNATVLSIDNKTENKKEDKELNEMTTLIRRMLMENKGVEINNKFKEKLLQLKEELNLTDTNNIQNEAEKKD